MLPATHPKTGVLSQTLAQADCARLTLVRCSSVRRAPTSATEPSVQLDLESGTICRWPQTAVVVTQPFQTVAENVFIWSVGPKRSLNLFNCVLEMLFLIYLHLMKTVVHCLVGEAQAEKSRSWTCFAVVFWPCIWWRPTDNPTSNESTCFHTCLLNARCSGKR